MRHRPTFLLQPLAAHTARLLLIAVLAVTALPTASAQAEPPPRPGPYPGYVASEQFLADWREARDTLNHCRLGQAVRQFRPLLRQGFDLADPLQRTKFYAGTARSYYEHGQQRAARRYARRWRRWALAFGDKYGNVGSFSSGEDAYYLAKMTVNRYEPICHPATA